MKNKRIKKRSLKQLIKETTEGKQVFDLQDLLTKADIPAIPIKVGDKELIVMIDTGSDASYLDSSCIETIPKKLLGHQEEVIGGTGIKDKDFAIYEIDFTCGNKDFKEIFTENDFSHIFGFIEKTTGVKLSGILGTRFLLRNKCILNFDKLVFYL